MNRYFVRARRPRTWQRPSLLGRLPEHYYRMQKETERPTKPVHDLPQKGQLLDYYVADPRTLRVDRKPDVRIPVHTPVQADQGLWAGDGIIQGYTKPKKKLMELMHHVYPKIWFPKLRSVVLYSEILDKYMKIVVTDTAIKAIEDAQGFDNYILQTPVQDLKSQLALDLRRKMLITLATRNFQHQEEAQKKLVYEKYKEFEIPLEEAEWFGLSIRTAVTKQGLIEQHTYTPRPLKEVYAKELIQKLEEMIASGELKRQTKQTSISESIFKKLPNFFNK